MTEEPEIIEREDFKRLGRKLLVVRLSSIVVVPGFNCRKVIPDSEAVRSLTASIKQFGLQEPLHLGRYPELPGKLALIDGEHRFCSCKLAGLTHVECIVDDFASQAHAFMACVVKSQHRKKLRRYELAVACKRLVDSGFAVEEVSDKVGIDKHHVKLYIKLLNGLIPELIDLFRRSDVDATVAQLTECLALPPDDQKLRYEQIVFGRTEDKGPRRGEVKAPKKRSKSGRGSTYLKSVIADLYVAEGINIDGSVRRMSDETRKACAVLVRHFLGDIAENPLVVKKGGSS